MSQNETKINQLKPGMRGVNVQVKVDSISEPRTVNLRNGGYCPSSRCTSI